MEFRRFHVPCESCRLGQDRKQLQSGMEGPRTYHTDVSTSSLWSNDFRAPWRLTTRKPAPNASAGPQIQTISVHRTCNPRAEINRPAPIGETAIGRQGRK